MPCAGASARTASILVPSKLILLLSCGEGEAWLRVLVGTVRAASSGGARLLARRDYQKYARSRRIGQLNSYNVYFVLQCSPFPPLPCQCRARR